MEIVTKEVGALEAAFTTRSNEALVLELTDLQLSLVGGGGGDVFVG
ncbi:hypothetical protein [Usitatibacter rugosus]|nr:hypothetical protein [Usitatibacter rugosus]